ncbi:MAG TPA: carboxylating nicotinate-nucleotide diphosphorylase [Planctomycetaceae bacterium]|nr:carboxylating nicotinate-nucleotide diphosphorylase [Planctomycetaceae bacterium]
MPLAFSSEEREAAERLIEVALAEDLGAAGDLTSRALIPEAMRGTVNVVSRADGIVAGLSVAKLVYERLDPAVTWSERVPDGTRVTRGAVIATVAGPLRTLLTGERTALNFLMHLSGVATLTRKFIDAVAGTKVVILDTRKTLPGWRLLEKYAVRTGGGTNHRMSLSDGCLIKDNHLAAWRSAARATDSDPSIAAAIAAARRAAPGIPVEVEVDTKEQLTDVLAGLPDIVLLDNMDIATLRECVTLRNRLAPDVLLEASGGISLNVGQAGRLPHDKKWQAGSLPYEIATTGVERISVGAITHSAPALDLAFDWP